MLKLIANVTNGQDHLNSLSSCGKIGTGLRIGCIVTNTQDQACSNGRTGLLLLLLKDPAVTKKACAQVADKKHKDSRDF